MAGGIPDDDIEDVDEDEEQTATVYCETSAGPITLHFQRHWSPNGYDRVVELFERGFYDETHFFRTVPNFLVQFGLTYSTDPSLKKFANTPIPDDPPLSPPIPFSSGTISFAGSGPDSRTSQIFIAYGPVKSLGRETWETPVGEVIEGMGNVRGFYGGYGDGPPFGTGPGQGKIRNRGRGYIEEEFPKLDHFGRCSVERHAVALFDDVEEKEGQMGTGLENTMEPNQKESVAFENDHADGDTTNAAAAAANKGELPKRLGREGRTATESSSSSSNETTDPVILFSGFLGVILIMLLVVVFKSKNTGVKKSV